MDFNVERSTPLAFKSKFLLVIYFIYAAIGLFLAIFMPYQYLGVSGKMGAGIAGLVAGVILLFLAILYLFKFATTDPAPVRADENNLYIHAKGKWQTVPKTSVRNVAVKPLGKGGGKEGLLIIYAAGVTYKIYSIGDLHAAAMRIANECGVGRR